MNTSTTHADATAGTTGGLTRRQLLAGVPVEDTTLSIAGTATSVLVGGSGPPMVLLHGPGEFAGTWVPVLGDLVATHQVIAPDLPGHGATETPDAVDAAWVDRWLDDLIAQTCSEPPVLVGRVVGGAVAARFAAEHPGSVAQVVLVDTTGLVPFEPDPRFGLALNRFVADPTNTTFERAMHFCAFDLDGIRSRLGDRWSAYSRYAVELVRTPQVQRAMGSFLEMYAAPIPSDVLERIDVPTTLIWGRHDLATPVGVAQEAAQRYGWPLHVIDDAGDDPPLDQPEAFVNALRAALTGRVGAGS
ncbi:MAG: alpha/beta fold hydrolase [Nocardioidaceae bacterium]